MIIKWASLHKDRRTRKHSTDPGGSGKTYGDNTIMYQLRIFDRVSVSCLTTPGICHECPPI